MDSLLSSILDFSFVEADLIDFVFIPDFLIFKIRIGDRIRIMIPIFKSFYLFCGR